MKEERYPMGRTVSKDGWTDFAFLFPIHFPFSLTSFDCLCRLLHYVSFLLLLLYMVALSLPFYYLFDTKSFPVCVVLLCVTIELSYEDCFNCILTTTITTIPYHLIQRPQTLPPLHTHVTSDLSSAISHVLCAPRPQSSPPFSPQPSDPVLSLAHHASPARKRHSKPVVLVVV